MGRRLAERLTGAAYHAVTERKQAEHKLAQINRQLKHYANNDHLTGLPNSRRHVGDVLAAQVAAALRHR